MKALREPKKTALLLTLGGVILLAALLVFGAMRGSRAVSAELASTQGERVAFLDSCGWQVDPQSETEKQIHIPERFGDVYERYNDLQRQQGYDLEPFRGMDCTMYSYAVENWPDASQEVIADLYIRNDRVIGGDVHSTALNGFMIGIK